MTLRPGAGIGYGCFQNIGGKTPKWMVYFMENLVKMDDLGGNTPIFGNTHMSVSLEGS